MFLHSRDLKTSGIFLMFAEDRKTYSEWLPEEKEPLIGRYVKIINPVPLEIRDSALKITTLDMLLPLTQPEIWNCGELTVPKYPTYADGWSGVCFKTKDFVVDSATLLPCCGATVCDGCHADKNLKPPGRTADGDNCFAHSFRRLMPRKITLHACIHVKGLNAVFEITSRSFARIFCTSEFLNNAENLTPRLDDENAFNHFLHLNTAMEQLLKMYVQAEIPFVFEGFSFCQEGKTALEKSTNPIQLSVISCDPASGIDVFEDFKIGS